MNNSLNKIIFLFFCTFILSCNKREEIINNDTVKIDSFQYNLKNKEKIFLDFWSGINADDFYRVYELLKSKNKMTNEPYLMTYKFGDYNIDLDYGNKLDFRPGNKKFYNKTSNIESIYLHLENQDVFEIFRKKYEINNLEKVYTNYFYLESNPLYGLNKDNISDEIEIEFQKERKELSNNEVKNISINNNAAISNISNGKSIRYNDLKNIYGSDYFENSIKYLLTKEIVIQTDDNFLIFYNSVCQYFYDNPNTLRYAFESKSKYNRVTFLYPEGFTESPYRIVKSRNETDIFVTYTTKKYYDKIKSEEKAQGGQDAEKDRKEKELIEKRRTESLNEI